MTRMGCEIIHCGICGSEVERPAIWSFHSTVLASGGIVGKKIMKCPVCGFCSTDLTDGEGIDREWLESEEYQAIIRKDIGPDVRYEAYAFLLSKTGDHSASAHMFMRAARMADDEENEVRSKEYRTACIDQLRQMDELSGNDALLLVEALRCTGRFDEASKEARKMLDDPKYDDRRDSLLAELSYIEDENDVPNHSAFLIWI